jgi:L-ascorbate metabolism protein UlaG (beta-lactamase superfamily)
MPQEISLRFLGHSAWQIQHGSYDILIDPFVSGNPTAPISAEELHPTHIILTHGHDDHLGDALDIARRTGALVIGSAEVASYVGERGIDAWGMSVGGARTFDFGRLKYTIAHHGVGGPGGYCMGAAMGVLLTIAGKTIYNAGDTGLFMDMKLIGELNSIDLALLPIGDNFTMGIDDAVHAVDFLKPKMTIPMHYNTFPPIEVDPEEFRAKVEARGGMVTILQPGESFRLQPEA